MYRGLAIIRTLGFVALTSILGSMLIIGRRILGKRPATSWQWRNWIMRHWSRGIAWLMGMRLTIHGTPPSTPGILVANHLGYLDIISLASQTDCVFVAKRSVRTWPGIGPLSQAAGTIFVDRERRQDILQAIHAIDAALTAGHTVVIFPEGTSTPGAGILPFRSPLLDVAARRACPVSWACLHYATPPHHIPAYRSVAWWGDMTFVPHLFALFHIPYFNASVRFGSGSISSTDRKLLAQRLHSEVVALFEPMANPSDLIGEWPPRLDSATAQIEYHRQQSRLDVMK